MSNERVIEKTVVREGLKIKLYSLDGVIWSSNKDELKLIKERLAMRKLELLGIKNLKGDVESNHPPANNFREVKRKAKKVQDITKSIVDIKAEEIRNSLAKVEPNKTKFNKKSKRQTKKAGVQNTKITKKGRSKSKRKI